jgi:hypothetical protein
MARAEPAPPPADPKVKDTPLFKIFHYYFSCAIPASYAYENQYLREGTPQYSNKGATESASHESVQVRKTVNELIELHYRGCSIAFNDPKVTVTIYGWLKQALDEIRQGLTYTMHTSEVPLEDISKMDDFARIIQMTARQYETSDITAPIISQKLDRMMQSRGITRTSRLTGSKATPKAVKEHVSVLPSISQVALERNLNLGDD